MVKKHLSTPIFWQCSTLLVLGLTCLIMGYSVTPAAAQPRIIEQFGDINNSQNVLAIQRALKRLGYNIRDDGVFGDQTRGAILNFQRANNLPVTGVVDNITAGTLFARAGNNNLQSPADGTRGRFCTEPNNRNEICAYVVLIPGDNNRLLEIKQQLLLNYNLLSSNNHNLSANNIVLEDHPRGLFIRINQYQHRSQAENVASFLRNNISPNFRVEYLPTVIPISARG